MVVLQNAPFNIVPQIHVVGKACNLRCEYCFYSGQDQSTIVPISEQLFKKFFIEFFKIYSNYTGNLTFIWHGGEPLLLGLERFKKLIEIQKELNNCKFKIKNALQTNGTLINREWINFFKKNNIGIGISYDGPGIYNQLRKTFNGVNISERIEETIYLLNQYGFKFGIIITITKKNHDYIKDILDFLLKQFKVYSVGLNFYFNEKDTEFSLTNDDAYKVIRSAFEWWIKKSKTENVFNIREIKDYIAGVYNKIGYSCKRNGTCGNFITLHPDGLITACARLCDLPEAQFGNLNSSSLLDILNGEKRKNFLNLIDSSYENCIGCKYFLVCRNGCSYHRILKIMGKYYFCESTKELYAFFEKEVKNKINMNF